MNPTSGPPGRCDRRRLGGCAATGDAGRGPCWRSSSCRSARGWLPRLTDRSPETALALPPCRRSDHHAGRLRGAGRRTARADRVLDGGDRRELQHGHGRHRRHAGRRGARAAATSSAPTGSTTIGSARPGSPTRPRCSRRSVPEAPRTSATGAVSLGSGTRMAGALRADHRHDDDGLRRRPGRCSCSCRTARRLGPDEFAATRAALAAAPQTWTST